jgi:hypothetical protein
MGYADSKYGVIERVWFGLTTKHGGQAAAGLTFNETEANKVTRFYPKGPIEVLKYGARVLATLGKGEEVISLYKGTTRMAQITASTSAAPYTVASDVTISSQYVAAGSYLSILASTNVCSTGTVACFIDYIRRFNTDGKWDA